MQKFLSKNLQGLLALGNWLDLIVFYAPTQEQNYLGVVSNSYQEDTYTTNAI